MDYLIALIIIAIVAYAVVHFNKSASDDLPPSNGSGSKDNNKKNQHHK